MIMVAQNIPDRLFIDGFGIFYWRKEQKSISDKTKSNDDSKNINPRIQQLFKEMVTVEKDENRLILSSYHKNILDMIVKKYAKSGIELETMREFPQEDGKILYKIYYVLNK